MSDKIKVGIIGVGSISKYHINSYMSNPEVEVYSFCDLNEKLLKKQGEKYNIKKLYTNIDKMLADEPLDAVSICTWNSEHSICAIKALEAGIHVLCEKPMAINSIEAKKMLDASEKSGKKLMIAYVRRFGTDAEYIKELKKEGFFGDIYYFKCRNLRRNGNPLGWFGNAVFSGGGPLIDIGVHLIDFARYILGEEKITSVYAGKFSYLSNRNELKDKRAYVSASATENDICNVEDMVTALLRFENGTMIQLEVSFSLNIEDDKESSIEIFGSKGGAKISDGIQLYSVMHGHMVDIIPNSFREPSKTEDSFQKEINHFVDCILNEKESIIPAKNGVVMAEIIDAIYRSAESGHEVIL